MSTDRPAGRESLNFPQSRCHHYVMAHLALKQLALGDPWQYLGVLGSSDAEGFLANIFKSISEHCDKTGQRADFTAADLKIHRRRVSGYPCAVIEMPTPKRQPEAYFTALVMPVDLPVDPKDPPKVPGRYFTLELSSVDGQPTTVLGEWKGETHLHLGPGPGPDVNEFLKRIEGVLSAPA